MRNLNKSRQIYHLQKNAIKIKIQYKLQKINKKLKQKIDLTLKLKIFFKVFNKRTKIKLFLNMLKHN